MIAKCLDLFTFESQLPNNGPRKFKDFKDQLQLGSGQILFAPGFVSAHPGVGRCLVILLKLLCSQLDTSPMLPLIKFGFFLCVCVCVFEVGLFRRGRWGGRFAL